MFKSLLTKDDAEPKAKFLSKWYPLWLLADLTSFALIDVKLLLHFFFKICFYLMYIGVLFKCLSV